MDKSKLDYGHLEVLEEKYKYISKTKIGTFEVFYFEDIMFDREGNIFPYARLSENAINFVHDGYLKVLRKDLEILELKFEELKEIKELKLEDFKELDAIFQISNIYLKQLLVFNSILGHELLPSDIFKVYENKRNTYVATISNLELLINSRKYIASSLYNFYNKTYFYSKYITEELKENNKLTNTDLVSNLSTNRIFEELDMDMYIEDYRAEIDLNIKFGLMQHPETHEEVMTQSIHTTSIYDLLLYDYYHAFYQSQYIKICEHCKRVFLQIKNYQTVYCDRVYPNSNGKTCRDLGPKEKIKNSPIHVETNKAKDRLRKRRDRGTISNEDYLKQTAYIDGLKDKALKGKLETYNFIRKISNI